MDPVIRAATGGDAEAIGEVHVRAWQAAYRGVMPDEYLDGLRPEDRAAMWASTIASADPAQSVLVAEIGTALVGFAALGPAGDDAELGELYAINLDPDRWGLGAGSMLLDAATERLRARHAEAVLWVVRQNDRAHRFYEHHGWSTDGGEKRGTVMGATVDEVRYRKRLGR